jgi:hypothetical protein
MDDNPWNIAGGVAMGVCILSPIFIVGALLIVLSNIGKKKRGTRP